MKRIKGESNYYLELQSAMMLLLGKKWGGTAGYFTTPTIIRWALLKATRKIRKRIHELVTSDDRLLLTTLGQIDLLEKKTKRSKP